MSQFHPAVAVCICTCDRPDFLDRLLGKLCRIELGALDPREVEIVVVDNHPNGQVKAVCEGRASELPVALHRVEEPARGIANARNRATSEAIQRGAGFLAFLDDDDIPEPDWLEKLLRAQRQQDADLVFGSWRTVVDEQTPGWVAHTKLVAGEGNTFRSRYGVRLPERISTCNVLVSRSVLERLSALGPVFAPEFRRAGEDVDFFIRAMRAGARCAVATDSLVNKECDEARISFLSALRRSFHWGRASMHVTTTHAGSVAARRKRAKALRRFVVGIALLPARLRSKSLVMAHVYGLANRLGMVFGSVADDH